jgi:hypothetical protein
VVLHQAEMEKMTRTRRWASITEILLLLLLNPG